MVGVPGMQRADGRHDNGLHLDVAVLVAGNCCAPLTLGKSKSIRCVMVRWTTPPRQSNGSDAIASARERINSLFGEDEEPTEAEGAGAARGDLEIEALLARARAKGCATKPLQTALRKPEMRCSHSPRCHHRSGRAREQQTPLNVCMKSSSGGSKRRPCCRRRTPLRCCSGLCSRPG